MLGSFWLSALIHDKFRIKASLGNHRLSLIYTHIEKPREAVRKKNRNISGYMESLTGDLRHVATNFPATYPLTCPTKKVSITMG